MATKEELIIAVEKKRTYFKTDNYSMSIGELKNLYEDNELIIDPEYQRLFRWSEGQKVRLIESVLMGIPIPTIFVYQDNEGRWEVVDGLQRISTLLQCMGVLKEGGDKKETLVLKGTKYLQELEGFSWDNSDESKRLPESLKLAIRRSKLNITIIFSESDANAKFEIFQRLNTGGSNASNQEVRDNIMVMISPDRYKWFDELSNNESFRTTISISDRQEKEQYHKELLLRYIALSEYEYDAKKDVSDFLDDINYKIIYEDEKVCEEIRNKFIKVFDLINLAWNDKAFKKDQKGKFLESAFEAIAIGLSKNIDDYNDDSEDDIEYVKKKIGSLYDEMFYTENAGSGSNAKTRINKLIPDAIAYFKKD